MLGVGFEFHVFTLLSGKKKTTKKKNTLFYTPKKRLLQRRQLHLESTKKSPFSLHVLRDTTGD